jgi:hypothetical protein
MLDDLMDSAYFKKVSELFTKVSHHSNISSILITQNLFHQVPTSQDITLNSKYISVFKNQRDKSQIVYFACQIYPENISSFQEAYVSAYKEPHSHLFADLPSQWTIYYVSGPKYFRLRWRRFMRPWAIAMHELKSQKHYLHVLKTSSPKLWRSLISAADEELIKAVIECVSNTLNGKHKESPKVKSHLWKYKNCLSW